jgi:hypothetical protein
MEIFVHQQNLLFFRKQLAARPNLTERLRLLKLLAEEEMKSQPPPNESNSPDTQATTAWRIAMRIAKNENLKCLRKLLTRATD